MKLPQLNMSKKIAGAILGVFVFAVAGLFGIQQMLYARNFQQIMSELEESVLT